MRREWLLVGIIGLLALLVAGGVVITTPLRTQTIQMHVKVADYVGINLDTDKLYFGTVSPGNKGTRDLDISSSFDTVVRFSAQGDIGAWVSAVPTTLEIDKGETQKAYFVVKVPANATPGNHTGTLTVRFYRPILKTFI